MRSGVAKVLCIVRPKGKQTAQERLTALLNKPLFAHLDKADDIGKHTASLLPANWMTCTDCAAQCSSRAAAMRIEKSTCAHHHVLRVMSQHC